VRKSVNHGQIFFIKLAPRDNIIKLFGVISAPIGAILVKTLGNTLIEALLTPKKLL